MTTSNDTEEHQQLMSDASHRSPYHVSFNDDPQQQQQQQQPKTSVTRDDPSSISREGWLQ